MRLNSSAIQQQLGANAPIIGKAMRSVGDDIALLEMRANSKNVKTLLLAITCTTIVAQSRDELIRKYGKPISETFAVRPGISASVSYAPNGTITELVISAINPGIIKSRGMTLSLDSAKSIIDELAPSSRRGRFVIGEFEDIICEPEDDCMGSSENYKNVTIYYSASATQGRIRYAVVKWKK